MSTRLKNLEKSGNSKVVREKSGKMEKIREKLGGTEISVMTLSGYSRMQKKTVWIPLGELTMLSHVTGKLCIKITTG